LRHDKINHSGRLAIPNANLEYDLRKLYFTINVETWTSVPSCVMSTDTAL